MNLIKEYSNCKEDLVYFIEKYIKLDNTLKFGVFTKRQDIYSLLKEDFFYNIKDDRITGKTTFLLCSLLWSALFNSNTRLSLIVKDYQKQDYCRKELYKLIESLPDWLYEELQHYTFNEFLFNNDSLITITALDIVNDSTIVCMDDIHLYSKEFINKIKKDYYYNAKKALDNNRLTFILMTENINQN